MKNNALIITVVVALVAAGLAFYGGMMYQQTKSFSGAAQVAQNDQGYRGPGYAGRGGRIAGRNGAGGATVGEIISQDDKSITIKLQDGSSKIINLAGSTSYSKTDTAAKTDLKSGVRVAAFGSTNSDGSITAQNIQINPMFRIGGGKTPRPTQGQ